MLKLGAAKADWMSDSDIKDNGVGVVVGGESKPPRFKALKLLRSRKFVLIFCVLLALASALTAYVLWRAGNTNDQTVSQAPPEGTPAAQEVLETIVAGDYTEAEQAINNNPELKNSRDGLMLLASVSHNKQDYQAAIGIYQKIAQQYGWTSNLAKLIAMCYASLGNKQEAINYYNKAITLLDGEKSPMKAADKEQYQRAIKELQQ
jgi:tetratricopeptide (TPR) repeat protein